MPVHDWSRVDAGTFHAFHTSWITHLMETLNEGRLPAGFYALSEQHAGMRIPDIVTLHSPDILTGRPTPAGEGGVALIDAPPRVSRKLVALPEMSYTGLRRTLSIRHVSGHRLVAIIEIVSPGNKDRLSSVEEFADKVESAIRNRIHVLLVDLFPPGKHDPRGIHGAAWACFDREAYEVPEDRPLTLASYLAGQIAEAYVEHVRFGEPLPEMPLFLEYRAHINVPLEATYAAAFRGMPAIYRAALEAEDALSAVQMSRLSPAGWVVRSDHAAEKRSEHFSGARDSTEAVGNMLGWAVLEPDLDRRSKLVTAFDEPSTAGEEVGNQSCAGP